MPKTVIIPDSYYEGYTDAQLDDIGVIFRIWKRYLQDVNHSRLLSFDAGLEELLLANPRVRNYKRHTLYHASFKYGDMHVSYYPSKGRWSVNNRKSMHGGFVSMINWLEKRVEK